MTWVYTCDVADQTERTWSLSSDQSAACTGGGAWVEITGFAEQPVDQAQVESLLAGIAMVLVIAFGFRLAIKQLLNR